MSEKLYSILYKISVIWLIYSATSFFSPFLRTVSLDTLVFKNNDGRIVVLQAMSHVAPEDFYTHVNNNIKSFLNTHNDGKIFLEGIYNDNEDDINNKEFVQKLENTDFQSEILKNLIHDFAAEKELGMGKVMMPLRLALVGELKGPDVPDIMNIIGKEKTIERIEKLIETQKK